MTTDDTPILEGRALRVERGAKVLVRDVDVEAFRGEVLGVLGPSGAGKSTLFRALVGEQALESGTVLLEGQEISSWPLWRRARAGIGYVPQGPSVLFDLTVRENLLAFQKLALGDEHDAEAPAKRVELAKRLDVRAGELSAGERRRLEVARAITRTPLVLICDEPFAGVDPAGAAHLGNILRELADDGVAVILADHHVAEALRICDRAALLLDGAVALCKEPDEFVEHELVRGRYLGTWTPSVSPSS